jgi:mRNA interferase RelE/StbE
LVYKIQIARVAQKQMLSLPGEAQKEIVRPIDSLANTPRPIGCKKLKGMELWRFRLGRYRVVYQINDKAKLITIVKVAFRKEDTYRGL